MKRNMAAVLALIFLMTAFSAVDVPAAEKFSSPAEVYWGQEIGLACWKPVENARRYEVRLYENEAYVCKEMVNGRQINLSQYMSDGNMYFFEVRAVPVSGQEKKYSAGDWTYCEEGQAASGLGDTDGRFRTYIDGKKYMRDDGGYVISQWYLIHGEWYYFNSAGYMQTGWQQIDGSWYYLKADGSMATGWEQTTPGKWYYLGADGRMLSDVEIEGHKLNADGLMVS